MFDYIAFFKLNPSLSTKFNYWFASINTTLANINRDTTKKPTPYTINDFILDWSAKQTEQDNIKRLTNKFHALSMQMNTISVEELQELITK